MSPLRSRIQLALILLSIFLTAGSSFAGVRECKRVFQEPHRWNREYAESFSAALFGDLGANGKKTLNVYDASYTTYSATAASSHEGVTGRLVFQHFDLMTSEISLRIDKNLFRGDSKQKKNGQVSQAYATVIREFQEFILKIQKEKNLSSRGRDRSWSEETIQQVQSDIAAWADVSKFVRVVLTNVSGQKHEGRPVIGTVKFVSGGQQSLKRQLPLEVEYGIDLPQNAGRKIEIGNYAVDAKWNSEATLEIFLQVAIEAHQRSKDPGHIKDQPLFYLASDPVTARIYRSLGFTQFREVKDHEGESWVVMHATAESIVAKMTEAMRAGHRLELDQSPERVAGAEQVFSLDLDSSIFQFWKFPNVRKDSENAEKRNFTVMLSEVQPEVPRGATSFPRENQPVRRLKVFDSGNWTGKTATPLEIFLPASFFPLRDGSEITLYPNIRVQYHKGVLSIERMNMENAWMQTVRIKVDADFTSPRAFDVKGRESYRTEPVEFSAEF